MHAPVNVPICTQLCRQATRRNKNLPCVSTIDLIYLLHVWRSWNATLVQWSAKRIMESKLFVGNLSYSTTEDDLKTLFAQAGMVKSVALIKDRESGRSKGFAFVEFETQAEAEKAISMLDGKEFQGRQIKVNLARPREDRPRGGNRFGDRRPRGEGSGSRHSRGGNDHSRY